MRSRLIMLILLCFSIKCLSQSIKKKTIKNSFPTFIVNYHVLKSDESILHGPFKKTVNGKTTVVGQYENNIKTGNWEYFDGYNGQLIHIYNYDSGLIEVDNNKVKFADLDTTKFLRTPVLLGGYGPFFMSISSSVNYPKQARRIGTEGKVILKGIITKEGNLVSRQVDKGIGSGCDEEALRIFKLLDENWLPALDKEGNPVEHEIFMPFTFKLN